MNELVWEGLLEMLRGDQPSLKASARLWRRDDFFGSDWGGQLELPVVFRRLLPPGEYSVRLPAGGGGTVHVAAGPSTTSMTFPTLTGVGHPPFGGAHPRPAIEVDREGETPMTQETQEPAPTATPVAVAAAVAAPAVATPAVIEVTEPQAEQVAALAASVAPSTSSASPAPVNSSENSSRPAEGPAAVSSYAPPPPPASRKLALVDASPRGDEGVAQTEAMARAFLAAVEARERLQAVAGQASKDAPSRPLGRASMPRHRDARGRAARPRRYRSLARGARRASRRALLVRFAGGPPTASPRSPAPAARCRHSCRPCGRCSSRAPLPTSTLARPEQGRRDRSLTAARHRPGPRHRG